MGFLCRQRRIALRLPRRQNPGMISALIFIKIQIVDSGTKHVQNPALNCSSDAYPSVGFCMSVCVLVYVFCKI